MLLFEQSTNGLLRPLLLLCLFQETVHHGLGVVQRLHAVCRSAVAVQCFRNGSGHFEPAGNVSVTVSLGRIGGTGELAGQLLGLAPASDFRLAIFQLADEVGKRRV